jgi:signal transduction histidine kinase/ligand-binding sensor domain-containing protein/CheY-like chemotaxis protein
MVSNQGEGFMGKLLTGLSLLFFAFLLVTPKIFAVPITTKSDPADVGRPGFRIFTDRDGLPQNSILSMAFDSKGYLWVGTQDGAAYYNGRKWIAVKAPMRTNSNFILSLLGARDGSMWLGRDSGGLEHFENGIWTNYNKDTGLPGNSVFVLLETTSTDGKSIIWAGTEQGLGMFVDGKWRRFGEEEGLPHKIVTALIETSSADGKKSLLAGTLEGLARFENGRWVKFNTDWELNTKRINTLLETVSADGTACLWVGTPGGLAKYENGKWTSYGSRNGLPSDRVRCLLETSSPDGKKTIWAGTNGGGLAKFENGIWTTIDARSGLPNNLVNRLLRVNSSNGTSTIWIGTLGGLARMEGGKWLTYDTNSGLPNNVVYSLLETTSSDSTSSYWIGAMDGGIARFENGKWNTYNLKDALPGSIVRNLLNVPSRNGGTTVWALVSKGQLARFEDGRWINSEIEGNPGIMEIILLPSGSSGAEKTLWAATTNGVARFENGKWNIVYDKSSGLPHNEATSLLTTTARDGSPILWVGTPGGLAKLENEKWTVYDCKSGLPSNLVYCIFKTTSGDGGDTVWAATSEKLSRFENGKWITYDSNSGLPQGNISGVLEINKNGAHSLWLGTHGTGVAMLDLESKEAKWLTLTDSTIPALPNNIIYEIKKDAKDRIYIFTNKGIARLTTGTQQRVDPQEFNIYTFTTEDGLPSNECNGGAAMVDSRGRIWAGTLGGAVMFDPSREFEDRATKPLLIERTFLNGKVFDQALGNTSLDYNRNNLTFEYSLLSYFRESDIRYRTQLIGVDDRPSEWTADHKKEYTMLPEGSYRFNVWGRDYAGNITGPVEVAFKISPAPWRTWWAYFLYIGAIVGIGYGSFRLRLQALRHRNEALEGKVLKRTAQLAEKIEELKASEKRAHEASRSKSVFLANMSHELRTPLNAILGFVQLMDRDRTRRKDDKENLAIIMRSGEHLLSLINEVLSVSKIETGQLSLNQENYDLKRMLQGLDEMFRMRAESKGLQLVFDLAPDIPRYACGDEGKLRQVLINILGNALKFTDTGSIRLGMRWRDSVAEFEIEDTGKGIPQNELEKVFEAFVQTEVGQRSKEGTGLGLTISRNFVRLMGGEIEVRSTPGKGSTFSFKIKLPAAPGVEMDQEQRRVIGLEKGQQRYRVLVADDKWENRALLVKILSSVDFDVREAVNGKEAVEIRESWNPDLIWMDMRMPVMDGYVATKRIRSYESEKVKREAADPFSANHSHVFIIALTASAFEHDRNAILAAGCDDFVTKPFKESTIFEKMSEHLGARFIYEAQKQTEEEPKKCEEKITRERFVNLPAEWIDSLNQAVTEGDIETALSVLDLIRDRDEILSDELRSLVKSYRFDEVQNLVESI